MKLLERIKSAIGPADVADDEEYAAALAQETAKVKAYRTADELAEASRKLMLKALELRAEIEAISDE